MKVVRGQVWSVLVNSGPGQRTRPRIEVRVMRVVGSQVVLQTAETPPHELIWHKNILARRLRGARLVGDGDKEQMALLKERIDSTRLLTEEEVRTASEVRKVAAPRGVAKCSDDDRRAFALYQDGGKTYAEVGAELGWPKSRVRVAVDRVRQAEYDARAVKALGS